MNPYRQNKTRVKFLNKQDIREIPFEELGKAGMDALAEHKSLALKSYEYKVNKYLESVNAESLEEEEASFREEYPFRYELKSNIRRDILHEVADEFAKNYSLKTRASWLLPQIVAHFGNWSVATIEGIPCGKQTIEKNIDLSKIDSLFSLGVYYLVMYATRSLIVETQYKAPGSSYCKFVPIILAAFKKYHNIKYSQWKRDTVHYLVDADLLEFMFEDDEVFKTITAQELLDIRELGLKYKSESSKKFGEERSPLTSYKLYGIHNTAIGHLPTLAQTAITQIWCAHPDNRTEDMILDPLNWDNLPPPLIDPNVLQSATIGGNKADRHTAMSKLHKEMYNRTDDRPW